MTNIKAVIFDYGGVIIDSPGPGIKKYCLKKLNISNEEFKSIDFQKEINAFQKGKIKESKFWNNIYFQLGKNIETDINIWGDALLSVFKEKKEILNFIQKLKKSGQKIGLITNTEKPNEKIIKKQNYNFFDNVVYSCSEGMRKPEKEIYELSLSNLNIKPHEAIFIDDKKENILGAKKVGMRTILFDNSKNVIKKVSEILDI